jgi:hypothetical protein
VAVVEVRVALAGRAREVRFRVESPPLGGELVQRLASRIEEIEFSETATTTEVPVEVFRVALAVERAGTMLPAWVEPTDFVGDASALIGALLNAHRVTPSSRGAISLRSPASR